MPDTLLAV